MADASRATALKVWLPTSVTPKLTSGRLSQRDSCHRMAFDDGQPQFLAVVIPILMAPPSSRMEKSHSLCPPVDSWFFVAKARQAVTLIVAGHSHNWLFVPTVK